MTTPQNALGDTRVQQATGLIAVISMVQIGLRCGWQGVDAINDNGIDGIIIDRKRGVDTGALYFVQIKCGDGYRVDSKKRPKHIGVNVGAEYIEKHRPRWQLLPGPTLLVYVDRSTKKCYWTDLRDVTSFCADENKSLILIPKTQLFGEHSLGELRKLRSFQEQDRNLPVVTLQLDNFPIQRFCQTPKEAARTYYRRWAQLPDHERTHSMLGPVEVSRVGWRHIGRKGRGLQNIQQSWQLLGAGMQMIRSDLKPYSIRPPDRIENATQYSLHDYISLRSRVLFPNRQDTIVQVILKRVRTISKVTGEIKQRIWFYSVHEPRRGKNGAQ